MAGLARIADGADDAAGSIVHEVMTEAPALSTQTRSDASNPATASTPTARQQSPANTCHSGQDAQAGPDGLNGLETAAPIIIHAADAAEAATKVPRRAQRPDVLRQAAQVLLNAWDELPGGDISSRPSRRRALCRSAGDVVIHFCFMCPTRQRTRSTHKSSP